MIGSLQKNWQMSWREVWAKLANSALAPSDLFIQLHDSVLPHLREQPALADYEVIHNDSARARRAFQQLKGSDFKGESEIVSFLEEAKVTIADFGKPRFEERYVQLITIFLAKYNLRYRVSDPFKLQLKLSGVFAGLYAELEELNRTNPDLAESMSDFEHAFDTFARTRRQADLKGCIAKASLYTEELAGVAAGRSGALGGLCDRLTCWPHVTVKEALKKLYGFCSDYPGIRHAGNRSAQIRRLDSRDAVLLCTLFISFSGFLPDTIRTDELFGVVH
ncbi:MAG: hypothetical protein PHW10_01550 [Candidatus Peribacteraceae bacterium]|nr:hypothetical protein [Candidatus Peribacteraceae bacterium]